MPSPEDSFDDPQLKGALQRLYGGAASRADDGMRARVSDLLSAGPASLKMPIAPPSPAAGRRSIWKIAAMIALLIGAGGSIGYQLLLPKFHQWAQDAKDKKAADDAKVALFAWMGQQLGSSPAADEVLADHPAAADLVGVMAKVALSVGRPVPAVQPTIGKWTLARVSIVQFKGNPVARFDFDNGSQHATLVSMSQMVAPDYGSTRDYQLNSGGHEIAGFIQAAGLHCVVGDPQVSQADVVALRDAVRF